VCSGKRCVRENGDEELCFRKKKSVGATVCKKRYWENGVTLIRCRINGVGKTVFKKCVFRYLENTAGAQKRARPQPCLKCISRENNLIVQNPI